MFIYNSFTFTHPPPVQQSMVYSLRRFPTFLHHHLGQTTNVSETQFCDIIHSFRSLPYHKPTASSKAVFAKEWNQFPASSRFLKVILKLPTSFHSPSIHVYPSLYFSFNNLFQKAVPTPNVTNLVKIPSLCCL